MHVCPGLGHPSDKLKIIGVTGANGKTTTSCLIAGILAHAGNKVGLLCGLGYFDGEDVEEPSHATLPPDRLATLLARMVHNRCTHAVMEVSSRALTQSQLGGVWFDAACVTNVTRDHLEHPLKLKNYRLAKSRLFDHLRGEAFVVLNADDPVASGYLRHLDGPVLTVGIYSPAEIVGTPLEQFPSEQTFLITAGSDTVPVRTQMIGTHHIYNCLTAAAVGLAYGIDLPNIVRSLEAAKHVPGRMERIVCGQPFSVFVDSAHTPDALTGSLQTIRTVIQGKVICVLGMDGNCKKNHQLMGRAMDKCADLSIITSDNSHHKNAKPCIHQVLSGFEDPSHAEIIPDRREAIYRALSLAQRGDCVLIAGKTPETLHIASEWLYEVQPFA